MKNITLYHAAQEMQQRIALCADEDGCLDIDKLNAIECAFHDRSIAYVAVHKTLGHQEAALEAVRAEYDAQIAKVKANRERLKEALMEAMRVTGTTLVKSDDGILTATLYPDRDESVELDPDATFPAALCGAPKPPAPSKTLIKAAILAGEAVAGARIVRKDRLQIK